MNDINQIEMNNNNSVELSEITPELINEFTNIVLNPNFFNQI